MDKFGGRPGEPGSSWEIMATGAKIWGLLALRLADHSIVPLDPIAQGAALLKYTKALEEQKLELDFLSIDKAVKHFQQTAAQLELLCQEGGNNGEDHIEHCNERFGLVERQFLIPEGLPKRRWFRHSLQAPGMNLGYAAEAFPGIQQAIDDGDLTTAQEQIQVIADRIQSAATFLKPK
jgi:N-acetylated-alpha-linked acidic dipeptidase